MSKERITFATKLGVIAATVGSAVGLGNIWRFPYETGQNGGGAFLLVYIACVLLLGIPVMTTEFSIGRASRSDANGAFKKLSPGTKWHYVGFLGIFASVFILGYYMVVAGWTAEYLYQSLTGGLLNKTPEDFRAELTAFTQSDYRPLIWVYLFILFNFLIISRGVQKGIEKASNFLMPLLFLIMLVFCIRSLFLHGAPEGLQYLFNPDFSKITPQVVLRAMGQAFFSMSLGMGILLTYGSYFRKNTSLVKTAGTVSLLDMVVAVLAGVIIFPAVFSFGISPSQGPELVFVTLPNIFGKMPAPVLWSSLFFLLLSVAALTSTISLCEVAVAFFIEQMKFTRRKATLLLTSIVFILSTLCSLSSGSLSGVSIFGKNIFDFCDYISANILLPVSALLITVYAGWVLDRRILKDQLNNGGTLRVWYMRPLLFCIRYLAPVVITLIFLSGLGMF